jgi:hypothetical protein
MPGAPLLAFEKWPADNQTPTLRRKQRGPLVKKRGKWRTRADEITVISSGHFRSDQWQHVLSSQLPNGQGQKIIFLKKRPCLGHFCE